LRRGLNSLLRYPFTLYGDTGGLPAGRVKIAPKPQRGISPRGICPNRDTWPQRGVTCQPRVTPWEQRSDVNHKSPERASQEKEPCLNRWQRIWSI
jgi:hypothetical protein